MKTSAFIILFIATWSSVVRANYIWKNNAWVIADETEKTPTSNDVGSGDYKYNGDATYGNVRKYEEEGSGSDPGVPSVDDEDSYQGSGYSPGATEDVVKEDDYVERDYSDRNYGVNQHTTQVYNQESDDISFEVPQTTPVPPRRYPTDQDPAVFGPKNRNKSTSFFAQPGILAAVVGGAVVGLLCAILFVMFIVYRMKKKDEGSYALDEPKRSPNGNSYSKSLSREIYA